MLLGLGNRRQLAQPSLRPRQLAMYVLLHGVSGGQLLRVRREGATRLDQLALQAVALVSNPTLEDLPLLGLHPHPCVAPRHLLHFLHRLARPPPPPLLP